jgi:RNA polymerase subunit RPABC4/transcription elongation factor Spt4
LLFGRRHTVVRRASDAGLKVDMRGICTPSQHRMSKITFRADDDLVERIEALDASKSEVMRAALRDYLEDVPGADPDPGSLDSLVADRIDRRIDDRLGAEPARVDLTITVEDDRVSHERTPDPDPDPGRDLDADRPEPAPQPADERPCKQCGEAVDPDHVYCPNCGEKSVNRVFCDCGDELRTDWAFCPSCGRRTPAADVLD